MGYKPNNQSTDDELRDFLRNRITNISTAAEDDILTLIRKEKSVLLEQIEGELPENKKVPEQRHAGGYSDLQTLCEQHNVIGYNKALGETRTILQSHKQQVDGEEL